MTKTPITDLLKKYLSVIEKVSLSRTLDTGYDTSNYTKAWNQAGNDAESFLNLQQFKDRFGGDADISPDNRLKLQSRKNASLRLANELFYIKSGEVRGKNIDFLRVTQRHINNTTQESTSHSYNWLTPVQWASSFHGKLLQESSPIQVSISLGDFWRLDPNSTAISVTRIPPFSENDFFTPTSSIKLEHLLHSGSNSFPRQFCKAQEYIAENTQSFVKEACDILKTFTINEEDLFILENLPDGLQLHELDSVVYDAIVLGVCDAANTSIHKKNKDLTTQLNRVGYQLLKPTQHVVSKIQSVIDSTNYNQAEESYLTPELIAGISKVIAEVEQYPDIYDKDFISKLRQINEVQKFNVSNITSSTSTMLYFTLAILINQITRLYSTKLEQDAEAGFFFGELGWNPQREEQLHHRLIIPSLASSDTPMVILKGTQNPGGDQDVIFAIEAYAINFSGKKAEPEVLSKKQAGITSAVHNNISQKAQTIDSSGNTIVSKEKYIDIFSKVNVKTNSLINSLFGRSYWLEALKTCYQGENNFKSGIFFVGLPPIFWDVADSGQEIYVPYKEETSFSDFSIQLPLYLVNKDDIDGELIELPITYTERDAAGIYVTREIFEEDLVALNINITSGNTYNLPSPIGNVRVIKDPQKIEARSKQVLNDPNNSFKSLSEIRKLLLKDLYDETKSNEKLLTEKCKTVLKTIFQSTKLGFWSIGNKQLACYNPFSINERSGRQRFDSTNTNQQYANEQRRLAISKLISDKQRGK